MTLAGAGAIDGGLHARASAKSVGRKVAEIISISGKRDEARKRQNQAPEARKHLAVQQFFRRACCAGECEKCGIPAAPECPRDQADSSRVRIPYRFCPHCAEEYTDYIARLQGGGDSACYWRNHTWLEMWRTWIDHRAAIDRHVRSKEFARLVQELKRPPAD